MGSFMLNLNFIKILSSQVTKVTESNFPPKISIIFDPKVRELFGTTPLFGHLPFWNLTAFYFNTWYTARLTFVRNLSTQKLMK